MAFAFRKAPLYMLRSKTPLQESGVRSQESGGKKEEEEKEKVFVAPRYSIFRRW
ncbi:hypothetical protein [Okeania sp. KiyG1]|uniref:hypothetical protein n=1 Tax=Okeania sp. KiyG1 TaxID=2720165 RepID=UPI001924CF29|nr:hypothetical protein [Okeania sp. KiyG1]